MEKSFRFLLSFAAACLILSTISYANVIPTSFTQRPDTIGYEWTLECSSSGWICSAWDVVPSVDHTITIGLSDGWLDVFEVVAFSTSVVPSSIMVEGYLDFIGGVDTLGTLTSLDNVDFEYLTGSALCDTNMDPIDPRSYRYTLAGTDYYFSLWDDTIYTLNPDGSRNYSLSSVPEPATVILLGSGLACIAWYNRKRRLE